MNRSAWRLLLVLILTNFAVGCQKQDSTSAPVEGGGPCWFADVTEEKGLAFVHDAGPTGEFFMPQAIGSGAAFLDFNNDSRLDIYLLQNGGPKGPRNQLYQQLPDGRFRNASEGSGLDIAGYNMGVAVGDINNDGWPDVLVTQYCGLRLFLNQGDGTFRDISREAGLDSPVWGASAAFFDYDRDGWLDLVVINYLDYDPTRACTHGRESRDFCAPMVFSGTATKLFHNLTGQSKSSPLTIRFEDVTVKSGLARLLVPGLGVACLDFNGDGWPDIFIANDGKPNRLWINQKDGTFTEEAVLRGIAYDAAGQEQAGMGVAVGDIDGDGLFDIFVTHLVEETNTLWRQHPRGLFHDRTRAAGLAETAGRGTGFGTVLGDFDHDGRPDLAVVNGSVHLGEVVDKERLGPFWCRFAQRNRIWTNKGNGTFRDISSSNAPFCGRASVARALVCGDIDGDGALDLLVTNIAEPARLYRNIAPQRGHWLMVRALDPALRRDAYGAEVTVDVGDRRLTRWLNPGYSYLCSNDPRAHFGLGAAQRVESIEILWPDGRRERFPGCAVDQSLVLRRGEGTKSVSDASQKRRRATTLLRSVANRSPGAPQGDCDE
jgi:hypothetical protein